MGSIRNIVSLSDGWLRIKVEPNGEIVSVPEHLRVEFSNSTGGRDFFTVIEGVHKGKRCSVKSGNLSPGAVPLRKAVRLVYDKSEGILTCGSLTATVRMDPENPIPNGEHPVQLPDFPHLGGQGYVSLARCAKTWFLIGHGHAAGNMQGLDRYLHTGRVSLGCVTVEPSEWNDIYEQIIKCRSNDGKTIGTIVVRK